MKERIAFNYAQRWKIAQQSASRLSGGKRINVPLLIGFLAIAAFVLSPWIAQYWMQHNLSMIERNISDYEDVAAVTLQVSELQSQVSDMNGFLQTLESKKKDPQGIINQITKLLPAGAELTSFSLEVDNAVQMTVVVDGPVDLAKLWVSFRDSGMFEGFDINSVSLIDEKQTLDLSFTLKIIGDND